jgi:hypothetical protein
MSRRQRFHAMSALACAIAISSALSSGQARNSSPIGAEDTAPSCAATWSTNRCRPVARIGNPLATRDSGRDRRGHEEPGSIRKQAAPR